MVNFRALFIIVSLAFVSSGCGELQNPNNENSQELIDGLQGTLTGNPGDPSVSSLAFLLDNNVVEELPGTISDLAILTCEATILGSLEGFTASTQMELYNGTDSPIVVEGNEVSGATLNLHKVRQVICKTQITEDEFQRQVSYGEATIHRRQQYRMVEDLQ